MSGEIGLPGRADQMRENGDVEGRTATRRRLKRRRIAIEADDTRLRLHVRNPSLPPEQNGVHGAGHAQRSIGHRLGYMFGARARMVSAWRDGYYDCEIVLPLDRLQP